MYGDDMHADETRTFGSMEGGEQQQKKPSLMDKLNRMK